MLIYQAGDRFKKNELKANELITEIQHKLKISFDKSWFDLNYLMTEDLIYFTKDNDIQKIWLSEHGMKIFYAESLLKEYRETFISRTINFTLVACNLILALAVFFDNNNANINSLNERIQHIDTTLSELNKTLIEKQTLSKNDTLNVHIASPKMSDSSYSSKHP